MDWHLSVPIQNLATISLANIGLGGCCSPFQSTAQWVTSCVQAELEKILKALLKWRQGTENCDLY